MFFKSLLIWETSTIKLTTGQGIFSRQTRGEGLADTGLVFCSPPYSGNGGFLCKKESAQKTGGVRTPQIPPSPLFPPCFQTGMLSQVFKKKKKDPASSFSTCFLSICIFIKIFFLKKPTSQQPRWLLQLQSSLCARDRPCVSNDAFVRGCC